MAATTASATSPSSAKDPSPALAAALSSGDLDAATACFARDGCLLTPDATTIRGRENIRGVLGQWLAMHPSLEVEQRGMLVSGDVAIATEVWLIRLERRDLAPFAQTSNSTTVLRRIEATWKLQIAAPWGWG